VADCSPVYPVGAQTRTYLQVWPAGTTITITVGITREQMPVQITLATYLDLKTPTKQTGILVDIVTPSKRSAMMSGIRGRDTQPEIAVRRMLRQLGVGYRLHVKSLAGRPDIVMQGRRKIIEVRGCWHRHGGCPLAYTPKSNGAFWAAKFAANVSRDRRNEQALICGGMAGSDSMGMRNCRRYSSPPANHRVRVRERGAA
jgi:DNA mismatch endonuclease, patch repair protein